MPIDSSNLAVVLLSGGLDSAVALALSQEAGHTCHTLSFDYAQRHRTELDAARRVATSQGVPFTHQHTLRIDLRSIGGSALTSDEIDVPKDRPGHAMSVGVPSTYVPARNLIFLSCAAALAETLGARTIVVGVNAIDYSGYPDCREPFLRAFEHAATLGTRLGSELEQPKSRPAFVPTDSQLGTPAFRIFAPLVHMTKPEIIQAGARLGVDLSLTHSCYDPVASVDGGTNAPRVNPLPPRACGRCDSCLIRAKGFADAGVSDPTRYA